MNKSRPIRTEAATFEVVKNALYAAAEEMKIVLAKTAYSPLLKVAGDYSCGLFDSEGEMVAQGPDLPIHLGSMPDAVKAVIQAFGEFQDGDVFIHNDPYFGGSHLPDVNVVSPSFHKGELLGFACVIDRSNKKNLLIKKKRIVSHMKINIPSFNKKSLPVFLKKIPITKPGSRFLK